MKKIRDMSEYIDYAGLRNDNDIRLAREKLKYSIRLQEEVMLNNVDNLKRSFFQSVRQSFFKMGMKWTSGAIVSLLTKRNKKKKKW